MGPRNPTETEGCTGERLIAFRKGRAAHDTCVSGRGKATGVGNILNHANTPTPHISRKVAHLAPLPDPWLEPADG